MTSTTSIQEPDRPDPDSTDEAHRGHPVPPYTGLESASRDGADADESDTDSSQESVNIVVNRETHIQGHRDTLYIPQNNVRELVHNSMEVAYAYANANRNSRGRRPRINLTINANVIVTCNNSLTTTDIGLYREITGTNDAPAQPTVGTTVQLLPPGNAQQGSEFEDSQAHPQHDRSTSMPGASQRQIRRQASFLGHVESLRRASQSNSAVEGADAIRQFLNAYPAPSLAPERNDNNNDNDDDLYSGP